MVMGAVSTAIQTKIAVHEAKLNRQFQKDMSNTAYRRGMRDLESAGLNPILAAKFGGASTPVGSTATMPGGGGGSIGQEIQSVTASGVNRMQKEAKYWEAMKIRKQGLLAEKQAQLVAAQTKNMTIQNLLDQARAPGATAKEEMMNTPWGKKLRQLEIIMDALRGGSQSRD